MTSLQNLFVGLVLNKHNIQILHWNTAGVDFDPVHEKLAEYIEQFEKCIDEVAEIARMNGEMVFNFANVYSNAESSSISFMMIDDNVLYYSNGIWANCKIIFDTVMKLYDDAIKDESLPSDIVSKLEEHQYWFRLENKFKNNSRIATPQSLPERYEAANESPSDDAGMVSDTDAEEKNLEPVNEPEPPVNNEPDSNIAPTDDFVNDDVYDDDGII